MQMHTWKLPLFTMACLTWATSTMAQQISPEMAKQVHTQTISNVHVVGSILHGGTASGDDGAQHLVVGVKLVSPLPGGVNTIEATVTHNEPSMQVQQSIAIYSGHAKRVGSVDLTCPSVRIVSFQGKTMAMGEECTFNSYKGPIIGGS